MTVVSFRLRTVLWFWAPVIVWLGVIFSFSAQPYDHQDLKPWLQKKVPERQIKQHFSGMSFYYGGHEVSIRAEGVPGFVEFFIRKGAHLMEYGVLGMLMFRLIRRLTGWKTIRLFFFTLLLCFAYAATDEFHQIFAQKRTPLPADVLLDSCGAGVGAMIFVAFSHFYQLFRRLFVITP